MERKHYILEILNALAKKTDDSNVISQSELTNHLATMDRKTVREHLMSLVNISDSIEEYGADDILFGYRVDVDDKSKYYIKERLFEEYEIRLILDAISHSNYISNNTSKRITEKLLRFLSDNQKNKFKIYDNILTTKYSKKDNNQVLYNVDNILNAIEDNCQITFQYNQYNIKGKLVPRNDIIYKVSPYYLITKNGRYYLICNYDDNEITTFRMDYMSNIVIIQDKRKPMNELEKYKDGFDPYKYLSDHIYFTDGGIITSKLRFYTLSIINILYDWFGNNVLEIKKYNDHYEATIKCDEDALFYWCMQYGSLVTVISPDNLKKRIRSTCHQMINSIDRKIEAQVEYEPINVSLEELYSKYILVSNSFDVPIDSDIHEQYWYRLINIEKESLNINRISLVKELMVDNNSVASINKVDRSFVFSIIILNCIIIYAKANRITRISNGKEMKDIEYYEQRYIQSRLSPNIITEMKEINFKNIILEDINDYVNYYSDKITEYCYNKDPQRAINKLMVKLISKQKFRIKI